MGKVRSRSVLALVTAVMSGVFVVALFAVYWSYNSQLAFAQAADSLLDVFTASVIAWTVSIAAQPSDEDHHFGHARAEPIGALVAAIIAGVLSFEVIRNSVEALLLGTEPLLEWPLAAAFAAKFLFKGVIALLAGRNLQKRPSPADRALLVDARNDAILNALSLLGYFAARYGFPALDAWLALPIAVWIGYAGFDLAQENIRLLLGEAPPEQRQQELLDLALKVPGVLDAHDLRAQFLGTILQVHLHVVVDAQLTLLQGHNIGENVQDRLLQEKDVGFCAVHVDIA